ncbi:MAG: flagellar biosynthetic protein FliO [Rhodospirillales bacterium]
MSLATYLQFALALVFVVALIGGLAVVARRFGLGGVAPAGKARRLAIVEVLAVDNRRRLVLIRRDHSEHLVLLGPSGDTVIETGAGGKHGFADALAIAHGPATPAATPSAEESR